jgi:very-long-chain (3R)-3-hydroxyacyl-CoA dehydratase
MDIRDRKPLRTRYLILYNSVNAILWFAVLGRVALLVPLVGFKNVYGGVGEFVKWTQTLAALEVAHAALGQLLSFFH